MDYNLLLEELRQASLFDLYRLQQAIGNLLDDPMRQALVKRQLRPGMEVSYFDAQANRLVAARVMQVRKSRVAVQDLETGKRWNVPVFMFNLAGEQPDIAPRRKGLDRLTLKVGDKVGFEVREGEELMGEVIKLNPKRAKLMTAEGIWNVHYDYLFSVIDGEQGQGVLLPRE